MAFLLFPYWDMEWLYKATRSKPMIPGFPQWRAHKVVGAVKIDGFGGARNSPETGEEVVIRTRDVEGSVWVPRTAFSGRASDNSRPLRFPDEYVGGYLVQYADGYLSWSPAAAFEAGYTRIDSREDRPETVGSGG